MILDNHDKTGAAFEYSSTDESNSGDGSQSEYDEDSVSVSNSDCSQEENCKKT